MASYSWSSTPFSRWIRRSRSISGSSFRSNSRDSDSTLLKRGDVDFQRKFGKKNLKNSLPLSSSKIRATSVAFFNIKRSSIAWMYGFILLSPRLYIIPFSLALFRRVSQPVQVISSTILIPLNKAAHTASWF